MQLLDGLNLQLEVTLNLVYQLAERFTLAMPDNYDWTKTKLVIKQV
ncbi:hypothetical protein K3G39_03155 [Pontibacter sp. HSC-14F20]|nr:hypothetical protein [Pontibacter sp. HSC-14F20]MBX0332224.1 hypothetical protein [Pontibacter sp. HSC-14F20]